MFKAHDYDSFTATRFKGLGVAKWGPRNWFFVDTIDPNDCAKIGATYLTKMECLADAERFASERGYKG